MGSDRAAGTALVQELAGRGHVIGDTRNPGDSGGVYEHHDPATGVLQARVPLGGAAEVDAAVTAAQHAHAVWRAVPMSERMAILYRLADLLDAHDDEACTINALDNGTPISAMRSGAYTAAWTRYYAGWVDKLDGEVVPVAGDVLDVVLPEPYGVVGAIVPWNGPMMGMGQKAVPALAAGNTVVVKPPEIAPFGALRFAELALDAGLPPGVLNVVVGGAAAGDALVRHPGIDKVSFTGGCATARLVMAAAAETLTPLTFELGGKSANIIFPDADLDVATSMAAMLGAVLLSGQGCALPTRLYVHDDVYDDVVGRVVAAIESVTVGDPFDPSVLMGPVVSERACARILGVIERAVDERAGTLLTGGRRLDGELADGYFVAPTVFGDVDHDSALARDEIFGPVLSVLRFHDEDEVVAKANDSDFGLSAYLHTADASRAQRVARRLEVGTVIVNGFPAMSPGAPFGGVKQSGFGREGGRAGIEEFVRRKNIVFKLMDYGAHLPLMDFGGNPFTLRHLVEYTERAADLGFGALAVNDHMVFAVPWLDGPTALAAVLGASASMTLATTVALPVVRGPVATAKTLAAIDRLSDGRLVVAVGPGSSAADYEAVGLDFDERWARLDEVIAALRSLWGRDAPAFVGRHYSTEGIRLEPRPTRDEGPPIWVGSWGSAAGLRRTARLADGWLASAYNTTPADFAVAWRELDPMLRAHGKDPETFPNALATMWFYLTDDRAEADRVMRDRIVPRIHRPEEVLRERLPVGPADTFAEKLSAFAAAGVQRVFVWPVADEVEQLTRFWETVQPAVVR